MVPQWGHSELTDGAQRRVSTSEGGMPGSHVGGAHQVRIREKAVFLFQEGGQRADVRIVCQLWGHALLGDGVVKAVHELLGGVGASPLFPKHGAQEDAAVVGVISS